MGASSLSPIYFLLHYFLLKKKQQQSNSFFFFSSFSGETLKTTQATAARVWKLPSRVQIFSAANQNWGKLYDDQSWHLFFMIQTWESVWYLKNLTPGSKPLSITPPPPPPSLLPNLPLDHPEEVQFFLYWFFLCFLITNAILLPQFPGVPYSLRGLVPTSLFLSQWNHKKPNPSPQGAEMQVSQKYRWPVRYRGREL